MTPYGVILENPLSGRIFGNDTLRPLHQSRMEATSRRITERRRRILLIVPASLRKQWGQKLYDKFSLPSVIVESKTYNEARKAGVARPFDQKDKIVIASYEFAALFSIA